MFIQEFNDKVACWEDMLSNKPGVEFLSHYFWFKAIGQRLQHNQSLITSISPRIASQRWDTTKVKRHKISR